MSVLFTPGEGLICVRETSPLCFQLSSEIKKRQTKSDRTETYPAHTLALKHTLERINLSLPETAQPPSIFRNSTEVKLDHPRFLYLRVSSGSFSAFTRPPPSATLSAFTESSIFSADSLVLSLRQTLFASLCQRQNTKTRPTHSKLTHY